MSESPPISAIFSFLLPAVEYLFEWPPSLFNIILWNPVKKKKKQESIYRVICWRRNWNIIFFTITAHDILLHVPPQMLYTHLESRDDAVVRALASHQCDPGSIPGPSVICGMSLLLVLYSAPRGFSPGTPVFPSPQKPTFPNSNSIWNVGTFLNEFLWTPWCSMGKQITFFYLFFHRFFWRRFGYPVLIGI